MGDRLHSWLLLAATLAGCHGTPPATPRRPPPTATAGPVVPAATPPAPSSATSVGQGPVPSIISDHGGSLTGIVRVPIISNNGSSVISNNGGRFHLLTTFTERPLAGATVKLLDAAGAPVQGLTAVTDANGAYDFGHVELSAHNVIAAVELPNDGGTLRAVVAAPGARDIDLISSLTTTYILDQYVKGKQETFDKLPPDVEADTRAKARAAFAAASVPVPDRLTPARVVATVTGLRRQDGAFDGQLEAVRKLLVAAGLSDLGNGQPGTSVPLRGVDDLVVAPDGTLWISTDDRVWRLRDDGKLEAVAGIVAGARAGAVDGKKATEAPLRLARVRAFDDDGRALLLEQDRVSRLEKDGTLAELWPPQGSRQVGAVAPGVAGDVLVLSLEPQGLSGKIVSEVWRVDKDRKRTLVKAYDDALGNNYWTELHDFFGTDGLGNLLLGGKDGWLRLDGKTGESTVLKPFPPDLAFVLPDGTTVARQGDKLVAGGETLASGLAPDFTVEAVTRGPDGMAYYAGYGGANPYASLVYRGKDLVAGTVQQGGSAATLELKAPSGLAVGAKGEIVVADPVAHYLLRVGADQKAEAIAGTGGPGAAEPANGLATTIPITPCYVALDRAGNTLALDAQRDSQTDLCFGAKQHTDHYRLLRIDPAGQLTTVLNLDFKQGDDAFEAIKDLLALPDGSAVLVSDRGKPLCGIANPTPVLRRVAPDGAVTMLPALGAAVIASGVDPAGAVFVIDAKGNLQRWSGGAAWELVRRSEALLHFGPDLYQDPVRLAVDGRGRLYGRIGQYAMGRWDPGTDALSTFAGKEGQVLNGTGVDDGLLYPHCPVLGPQGDLYILDTGNHQVKRVPADKL